MKLLLLIGPALLLTANAFAQASTPVIQAGRTLEFIENKGQWDARARYEAPLPGGRLFAEANGLTFSLLADGGPAQLGHRGRQKSPLTAADKDRAVRGHAFTLHFDGATPTATLTAETPTAEHRNYFLGADPKHWASDVRSFRELRYAGLWPGVNARVYESADQHLEYDFELVPGAQPAAIGLRHDGADGVALDAATGNLLVKTSVGTVTERAPQAWQTDATGRRRAVACRYVLAGPVVRFALGAYDATRPLTIDPVVVFSTYSGSTADNWGFTATYDNAGNLYSGGIAFDVGYPTTTGAYQTNFANLIDIALIKYNTSVSGPASRVWATYLGGSSAEFPHSLVVNNLGELLVLGSSSSSGLPGSSTLPVRGYPTTSGAFQRNYGGGVSTSPLGYGAPYDAPNGSDLVITRLSATGSALLGSTFLGGSGNDGILPLNPNNSPFGGAPQLPHNYGDPFRGDILVDGANNVYIASHTASPNFPVANGFNSTYRGGTSDGVVCKLTPGLTALTWSSFLGGSGADAAYSIQIEPTSGDVYVAGGTLSANFPVTPSAYRTARPGDVDGFVTRIAASGTSLLRASYVGTSSYDQAYFLQLGTDGGVYLLGQTLGQFPTTTGLYRTTNGTQFIQKLDANLGQSLLSTSFGSSTPGNFGLISLDPTAFLVDRCDRVYVCGWGGMVNGRSEPFFAAAYPYQDANGTTTGLPVTADAAQQATDGSDFYLAQFSAGLTSLAYATYYGNVDPSTEGEHVDGGTARFDPRGIVYQAVCSCFSTVGFPIPAGANTYSTTNNSSNSFSIGCNNAAFVLNFQPGIANAGPPQTLCTTASPVPLTGTPTGGIWTGPGVTGSVVGGYVFTPSTALVGTQTLTYTVVGTGLCTTTDTRLITVLPPASAGLDTTLCANSTQSFRLRGTPAGGVFSGPGVSGSVASGFVFTPPAGFAGTLTLTYTVGNALCSNTARRLITAVPTPGVSVFREPIACPEARLAPLSLQFRIATTINTSQLNVLWDFGDGSQSTQESPVHTYARVGTYQPSVRLRYNSDQCEVLTTIPPVEVLERRIPNIITPNGDGQNQTFRLGPDCPPRLQIFSRWGRLVFESAAYRDDWSAAGSPDGVYYYLITYPDGHRLKGIVEVVR
jgi:hypothetical protein